MAGTDAGTAIAEDGRNLDLRPEGRAMQPILNRAAMANDVAPAFLEFIGVQDERHTVGKVLYHFTITDPDHRRYKSTVAVVVSVRGRRATNSRSSIRRDRALSANDAGSTDKIRNSGI